MTERSLPIKILGFGVGLVLLEGLSLALILARDPGLGLRLLSMIGACHVGGRLAFIGAGFEGRLPALAIAGIVTLHNTTVLLLVYSLWLLLCEKCEQIPFLASLRAKVQSSRGLRSRWNLLGIAVFIWVPLPMTGAVAGALIAHFEGYPPRQVLAVSLGAMVFAVVSWTLAFEPLYTWMRSIGPQVTTVVTLLLVLLPVAWNVLWRKNSAPAAQ